jgi:hypothetical protein
MPQNLFVYLLVFIWLGTISFLLFRLLRTFSKLTKGVSNKDLRVILETLLKKIDDQDKNAELLKEEINKLKTDGLVHLQKVGLVRYNPFSETGGNQSFVLALLDGNDSGLVITSLHSREATRVFTKPVKSGKESGYEFSKEEIQAILAAKKSNG